MLQLWPEEDFPLIEFGRMVLDTNVKNYYSEVHPAIHLTSDTILQGFCCM